MPIALVVQLLLLLFLVFFSLYFAVIFYMVWRGANYIPTPKKDIQTALSVLHKGDEFIDLGFGRGEVLQAAYAKGANPVIGYELEFFRFVKTWWKFRGTPIQTKFADIWTADVSTADEVFTFFTVLHTRKLYEKLRKEMKKGSWFVSYVHPVPGVRPTKKIGHMYFFKM